MDILYFIHIKENFTVGAFPAKAIESVFDYDQYTVIDNDYRLLINGLIYYSNDWCNGTSYLLIPIDLKKYKEFTGVTYIVYDEL